MKTKLVALLLLVSSNTFASNFQEDDVYSLFQEFSYDGKISKSELNQIVYVAKNPYAPTESHAGDKFLEALSWYNDMTLGNKDGYFTLSELELAFNQQLKKYLNTLFEGYSETERMSAWKMLQKLEILRKTILEAGDRYYAYRANDLSQINHDNEWNRRNTITSRADFNKRVLAESWKRPVLIKFGLTYCVHCLLMENLASVPAVAQKYEGELSVYKLWWNPKDQASYYELNQIAAEQGITSSPMFNLYINGKLVKSGYAFPDEQGNGLEEFLEDYL
jgi:thiol-disulfide isomerase/thioredoxin